MGATPKGIPAGRNPAAAAAAKARFEEAIARSKAAREQKLRQQEAQAYGARPNIPLQ